MQDDDGFIHGREVADELNRLERVLEATGTIIWEVNMDELTTQTFGPVETISGVPSLEFDDIFSNGQRFLHPKDRLEVAEEFVPLLEGRTDAVELEYRTHPDNGPVRWVKTKAFIDETGSTMLIGMLTDITDQKEYEARLESFASVISHDLRNPLSVAKGRLE